MVCCAVPFAGKSMVNLLLDSPVNGQTCTGHYAQYMAGTACEPSCAAGELTICTANAQCPGQTCVPFRKAGYEVGACQ
jgi:hypothetical protein